MKLYAKESILQKSILHTGLKLKIKKQTNELDELNELGVEWNCC